MEIVDQLNFRNFLELYIENPKRVIFFIGAGLSMPLFPSWAVFLKQLINNTEAKGKLDDNKEELINKIDYGQSFLEIADYCAEAIGKLEYREIIEKNFNKKFTFDDIPNAYQALLNLDCKSILTTNYDRIPEIGSRGTISCYTNRNISEASKAVEKGTKVIVKIHGDVLNQESIILTESDFKKLIHNNGSVQNALKTFFSSSTVCFLGFGFSDPHFNLILDFLSAINDGQTIVHYALLAAKSKFEIHSIEKKGIRVIEYSPENNHAEIEDFLNRLNGVIPIVDQPVSIDNQEQLFSFLENKLQSVLGIQNYYLDYSSVSKMLTINYFIRANTQYELQKEIISIYKIFDFDCPLIANISICSFLYTEKDIEYINYCPLSLNVTSSYSAALKLSLKGLNELDFWKQLKFRQPYLIGSIHFTDRDVEFPYMNF